MPYNTKLQSKGFLRPNLSLIGPKSKTPIAKNTLNTTSVMLTSDEVVFNSVAILGKAGRYISVASGAVMLNKVKIIIKPGLCKYFCFN